MDSCSNSLFVIHHQFQFIRKSSSLGHNVLGHPFPFPIAVIASYSIPLTAFACRLLSAALDLLLPTWLTRSRNSSPASRLRLRRDLVHIHIRLRRLRGREVCAFGDRRGTACTIRSFRRRRAGTASLVGLGMCRSGRGII